MKGTTYLCNECGHTETWSNKDAAGCASTWHIWDAHPDIWHRVIGDRPPADPRPETRGRPL